MISTSKAWTLWCRFWSRPASFYRLVLWSSRHSRFLNSEGKICWVTSSAFIHAQWQASFLALFRNLTLWRWGAAFRDLKHNVQFQGPQPIGPCWSEDFCELCITTEVLPPSSLLNISALLVPDQFSSLSQTLKFEILIHVLKMSTSCHVWLIWSRLFLPSVSSKSTLETTPVLRSLSTAAWNKVPTDENWRNWYYIPGKPYEGRGLQCRQHIDSFVLVNSPKDEEMSWNIWYENIWNTLWFWRNVNHADHAMRWN